MMLLVLLCMLLLVLLFLNNIKIFKKINFGGLNISFNFFYGPIGISKAITKWLINLSFIIYKLKQFNKVPSLPIKINLLVGQIYQKLYLFEVAIYRIVLSIDIILILLHNIFLYLNYDLAKWKKSTLVLSITSKNILTYYHYLCSTVSFFINCMFLMSYQFGDTVEPRHF